MANLARIAFLRGNGRQGDRSRVENATMEAMGDEPILRATCDEGGEAPCFAHLLDDEATDDDARSDAEEDHDFTSGTATAE
jgi:hypothetical protein